MGYVMRDAWCVMREIGSTWRGRITRHLTLDTLPRPFCDKNEETGNAGEHHHDDGKQTENSPVHALGQGGVGCAVAGRAGEERGGLT